MSREILTLKKRISDAEKIMAEIDDVQQTLSLDPSIGIDADATFLSNMDSALTSVEGLIDDELTRVKGVLVTYRSV